MWKVPHRDKWRLIHTSPTADTHTHTHLEEEKGFLNYHTDQKTKAKLVFSLRGVCVCSCAEVGCTAQFCLILNMKNNTLWKHTHTSMNPSNQVVRNANDVFSVRDSYSWDLTIHNRFHNECAMTCTNAFMFVNTNYWLELVYHNLCMQQVRCALEDQVTCALHSLTSFPDFILFDSCLPFQSHTETAANA